MLKLGDTAKFVRERVGITQRLAAEMLEISVVHLCNIENNKSGVSDELIRKYKDLWNVDLYILAWCTNGDVSSLPPGVRGPATKLAEAWTKQLGLKASSEKLPC